MEEVDKELIEQETKLRHNFEKFYESFRINGELSFQEIAYLFYKQGHLDTTPVGVEVNTAKFMDEYQREAFIRLVEDCIENPESTTEASQNDYVLVEYKCPGHDCIAWPDRCEDVGGDGETCTTLINLSKLCGVESSGGTGVLIDKHRMLTADEVKTLTNIVERLNMK